MPATPWVRRAALAAMDVVGWTIAVAMIVGVRLDFTITDVQWESVVRYLVTVAVLTVGLGYATKFYRGRFLVGSFDEALGLTLHLAVVGALMLGISAMMTNPAPRSVVVLTPPMALLISAAGRLFYRALRDRLQVDHGPTDGRRVLIY